MGFLLIRMAVSCSMEKKNDKADALLDILYVNFYLEYCAADQEIIFGVWKWIVRCELDSRPACLASH
jgi:hypothetical protein